IGKYQEKLYQVDYMIRTNVTYLDGKEPQPDADTMYTRYTFSGSTLYISFYQAWDTYKQEWSSQHNQLTIGLDTYTIETLTDTSLTIALAGFRRVEFLSEEYLSSQDKNLVPQGEYNGKPLYLANNFITPRYSKRTSLYDEVQKDLEMSNIRQATNFLVTFVVTEEGKIENPQVVKSISPEYDRTIIERIQKTTKKWKPAYFKGKPVQTQLTYEVKYLPSIVPARSPLKIN
ncbi:MAG: energy transducer TonB, partial [Niastella sp.]|nr:energy transducer TonB [Niastella sp.]